MIKRDYHIHSTYSDGKNKVEEIVKKAIELNLDEVGISDHSYTFFDESYCIKKDKIAEYIAEIERLKAKYKDKIKILCGIEQDFYSTEPCDIFDYVILSVHYIKTDDKYIPVDESAEILKKCADDYFNGDIYSVVELYFDTVSNIKQKDRVDIIGHFDLITKFNEKHKLFDENSDRYIKAYQKAVDSLIDMNVPFEINTGAISRGYKTTPYPSKEIREYIEKKGGKFILSSDSHSTDTLCYNFEKENT